MGRRVQAIATPHRGPTEQAVLALAGPHGAGRAACHVARGQAVAAPAAQR